MPEMPCPNVQYNGYMLVLQGGFDTKEYNTSAIMTRVCHSVYAEISEFVFAFSNRSVRKYKINNITF